MVIHVSKRLRYERCETTSASDREVEAQSCFKLTLEYRLSWRCCMRPMRSSIRKRRGSRVTGKSDGWESAILRGRGRDRRESAAAALSNDRGDEGKDLLERIGGQPDGEPTAHRDMPLESPTKELNPWLDSSHSSTDGVRSGPSSPQVGPGVGRGHGLCSRCQVVWEKARHTKRPLKDTLLDNDPSSLSCDQWVLKKTWRPSGMHVLERNLHKLQGCLELIQIRQSNVYNVMQGQSSCSRAHTFLRRNLRLCSEALARRERKRRKRKSTRRSAAKRARRDPHRKTPSLTAVRSHDDGHLPSRGRHTGSSAVESTPDRWSEEDDDDDDDGGGGGAVVRSPAHSALEQVPSSVTMETTVKQEAAARQEGPAKRGGFKVLLTQMRGNSRLIVREHRQ